MSYRLIMIEQKDKFILRYQTNDQFNTWVTEEFPKTHSIEDIARALSVKMQLNTLVES